MSNHSLAQQAIPPQIIMADKPTDPPANESLQRHVAGEITRPEVFQQKLEEWHRRGLNVITPLTSFSALAPQHLLIYTIVPVDADPNSARKDVYYNKFICEADEVALSAIGLSKISRAGGISIKTVRTSPYTIQHFWEFRATATWKGVDGLEETQEAHAEFDLRDGSDRLKGFSPAQISQFRTHGMSHCESRAINRVIRKYGALKGKYKRAELAQPFVIVRVMFKADMSDPRQRQMVVERGLASSATLYPSTSRALPPADEPIDAEIVEREKELVPQQTKKAEPPTEPAQASPQASQSAASDIADTDNAPTPNATKIVKVTEAKGVKNGKPWARWDIVCANGTEASTFSESLRDEALRFKYSGDWVDVVTERNGNFENIVKVTKSQPMLFGGDGDGY